MMFLQAKMCGARSAARVPVHHIPHVLMYRSGSRQTMSSCTGKKGITWTGLGSVSAGLTVSDGSVAGAVTNDDSSDAVTGLRGSAAPPCASITAQRERTACLFQPVLTARL